FSPPGRRVSRDPPHAPVGIRRRWAYSAGGMFDSIASIARAALAGGVLTLVCTGGAAAYSPPLQTLLDRVPADSLVRPLERFERFHRNAAEAGEASLVL